MNNKQVDVDTLLSQVASMLAQNQGSLNKADAGRGGGTHGERMAQAFQAAAEAARQADTNDAGKQLALAANAMRQQGRGKAVTYYANGLQEASQQFQGQNGISLDSLLPLLQSFLGGVQQNNPARPGQGTMIDALLPAVRAFTSAQRQGMDPKQAALEALTSAITGARSTSQYQQGGSSIDPGAASATNILGGIFSSFLPGALDAAGQGSQQDTKPNDPLGGLGGLLGSLGGLAEGMQSSQHHSKDQDRFV